MPLVGDILYRWRGDTTDLERAYARSDKVIDESELRLQQFAKVLKITGGIAGGVAVAGLLQYHGVFTKIGITTDKTAGLMKKLSVVVLGVGATFAKALTPLRGFLATIGTMAVAGMNKLFTAFGSASTVSTIGAGLKKSFQKMWTTALAIPTQAGEGLKQLGAKMYPAVEKVAKQSATLGHIFNTLAEGTYGLGGAVGKTAGAMTAFAGVMKLVQMGMQALHLQPIVDVLGRISAGVFTAVGAIALFIRKVGEFVEGVGDKLINTLHEWVMEAGEMQRSIWGLGVALEGYRKRVGETTLSLEDFTKKTLAMSATTGISMNVMHQGVLQMMDLARVTGLTAEQIYGLLERLGDFSTVTETDFMSVVYATDQAFRGYWRSLSSLGLQMDDSAISQSAFGKGLDDVKQGVANAATATAKYNFLMHELDFVAGKAAESVGKTLPDAIRYSESTWKNLHSLMTIDLTGIWAKYYKTIGDVGKQLMLLPQPVLQASGTIVGLGGVIFKTTGFLLKWAATITVAISVWRIFQGLLGKPISIGPAWIRTGEKTIKQIIFSFFQLNSATVGLWAVLKGIATFLKGQFVLAMKAILVPIGAFIIANALWIAAIVAITAAIATLIYMYRRKKAAIEETRAKVREEIKDTERTSKELEELEKILKDTTKTYEEKNKALRAAAIHHREIAAAMGDEKKEIESMLPLIEELNKKNKERADTLKGLELISTRVDITGKKAELQKAIAAREEAYKKSKFLLKAEEERPGRGPAWDPYWTKQVNKNKDEIKKYENEVTKLEKEIGELAEAEKKLIPGYKEQEVALKGLELTAVDRYKLAQIQHKENEIQHAEELKWLKESIKEQTTLYQDLERAKTIKEIPKAFKEEFSMTEDFEKQRAAKLKEQFFVVHELKAGEVELTKRITDEKITYEREYAQTSIQIFEWLGEESKAELQAQLLSHKQSYEDQKRYLIEYGLSTVDLTKAYKVQRLKIIDDAVIKEKNRIYELYEYWRDFYGDLAVLTASTDFEKQLLEIRQATQREIDATEKMMNDADEKKRITHDQFTEKKKVIEKKGLGEETKLIKANEKQKLDVVREHRDLSLDEWGLEFADLEDLYKDDLEKYKDYQLEGLYSEGEIRQMSLDREKKYQNDLRKLRIRQTTGRVSIALDAEKKITDLTKTEWEKKIADADYSYQQMMMAEYELYENEEEIYKDRSTAWENFKTFGLALETDRYQKLKDLREKDIDSQLDYSERTKDTTTQMADGINLALQQVVRDTPSAVRALFEVAGGAIQSFEDATVNTFHKIAMEGKITTESLREIWIGYASEVVRSIIKMGVTQTIGWIAKLKQSGDAATTAASKTLAAMTTEGTGVITLTALYWNLAIAKSAAGMSGGGMVGGGGAISGLGPAGIPLAGAAPYTGMQVGGKVPGEGEGDKVPVRLEPGEWVIPKKVVKLFGEKYFQSLTKGAPTLPVLRTNYQQGGRVTESPGSGEIKITMVNLFDEDEMHKFYGSKKYGDVIVNRVSERVMKNIGRK